MRNLLLLAILVCFSANAYAAQFDTPAGKLEVYSSIRGYAGFSEVSDVPGKRDDSQFKIALQSNTRFGTKFSTSKLTGHVEFGGLGSETSDKADPTLRLAYGDYKLDNGNTFRFGQFATASQASYNRVGDEDGGLDGFGNLKQVRRTGLGYYVGDLSLHLYTLSQDAWKPVYTAPDNSKPTIRFQALLPRFEAAYKLKDVKVYGSFAVFNAETESESVAEKEFDATAYHFGVNLTPKFGNVGLNVNAFYASNAALYGMVVDGAGKGTNKDRLKPALKANSDEVEDITTFGGALGVNFKIDDSKALEVGVGYQVSDQDGWDEDAETLAIYAQLPITVMKGFKITPELGYFDYGSSVMHTGGKKVDEPKVIQALVQFRFDI